MRQSQQVIGFFNAIPVVVTIHGVVTTHDRSDTAFTQFGKQILEAFQ
ncbi:Uncharacterised protein [Vibrio cholerae]|nr:Uncharacterised protein [Vibrio cholerae]CSD00565.1 Uncharacterised protein [Vibrio cholerae]CSD22741.1 Uncharacterised protein [Vibrio cholerae]CSI31275.1 Uncharacterised protein [Vibrio cholerae]